MNRRNFIKSTGISALGTLTIPSLLQACHTEEDMIGKPNWIVEGNFNRPLTIPAVQNNLIQLQAGSGIGEMLNGKNTSILSYYDSMLGPTIKTQAGETITIQLQNNLSEDTNIHWHGLILPDDMDGHPMDVAEPGGSYNYVLPVQQRAGTYWYHPHPHGSTARQVFMGLAGMFIVNDAEEAALNLPADEFEIPLIIQDKRFSGSSLDYSPTEEEIMSGYLGETILVNGLHAPYHSVEAGWYRLRIVNGSTARVYKLAFSNEMDFYIIGSDGGLLRNPEKVKSQLMGPGERLDILVNFKSIAIGKSVYLISRKFSEYNVQGRQEYKIMKFTVDRSTERSFTLPETLTSITAIPDASAVATRSFDISALAGHNGGGGHAINGKMFDMHRIDETVAAGTSEIWEFDNRMGEEIHPMHIHGVQFQVLERKGGRGSLIPAEKGWKDTVLVMPGEKVSVIMTFPLYTGVFVFHCHNLEHEDDGMMLNYKIV